MKPLPASATARGSNANIPPQWLVYISVADVAESARRWRGIGRQGNRWSALHGRGDLLRNPGPGRGRCRAVRPLTLHSIPMRTDDFDYHLPPDLIAQTPVEPRDASRLLVFDRVSSKVSHRMFVDILDYLKPGDVMVFNQSRVIQARIRGRRADTGGKVEFLLLNEREPGLWRALAQPGRRLRPGARVVVDPPHRLRGPPWPWQQRAEGPGVRGGAGVPSRRDEDRSVAAGRRPRLVGRGAAAPVHPPTAG